MNRNQIEVFILIGGRSSRLGMDKAFVRFQGERLAERTGRIVKRALGQESVTFVAASESQFDAGLIRGLYSKVIYDRRPGLGTWSGLHTALASARREWIFLVACDHPLLTPEFLKFIAEQIGESVDIVIPRQSDGRIQPLCAFYRVVATLPAVESAIIADGRLPPLADITEKVRTRVIGYEEYSRLENAENFFVNINSNSDLAVLEQNVTLPTCS